MFDAASHVSLKTDHRLTEISRPRPRGDDLQPEAALRHREAILEAVGSMAARLLRAGSWRAEIPQLLGRLGRAAGVSRAYIFEHHRDERGQLLASLRHEWAAEGMILRAENPDLQDLSLETAGFGRWAAALEHGQPICGDVRDFPAAEREVLAALDICSIAVAPILVGRSWQKDAQSLWGFIGFDECCAERQWLAAGMDALEIAADLLAAAIERERRDDELRAAATANAQLLAAEREQRTLAEALSEAAAALTSKLSLDAVLDRILEEVGRVAPHDAAEIILAEGGVGTTVRTHNGIDPRMVRSHVGAPLRARRKIIGFLSLDSATPDLYTQAQADHLQAFADQAGIAVENARLYEKVQRHAAELEQRVAERTADLARREAELHAANVRLQETDRLKRQFLASVSHELRTPLTNIKSSIWLLEHGKPEKRDYYAAVLSQETDALHALVEDVLTLTALDLGKLQPDLQPLELSELITKAVADRESLFAGRRLTSQMRCPPDLPRVNGDGNLLALLLSNLIALTVDRSMHGGVIVLDCVPQVAEVEPAAEQPVALADSAIVLAQPAAAREGVAITLATGPHAATSAATAGLRMAICEEIVKQHHGQITEARDDQESHRITVWLPVP